MVDRLVIGEGSFGCVHKPSLHCKDEPSPGFDYRPYVSKLMTTDDAEKELAEFVTIGELDTANEYHVGSPILCEPNLNEPKAMEHIKNCKQMDKTAFIRNPDNYSLLLLKYGGTSLNLLCETFAKTDWGDADGNYREKLDLFMLGMHNLFKGLLFFKNNNIVHYDIKQANILFNPTTNEFKYIDFGNMDTKTNIVLNSENNDNQFSKFLWSLPLECNFMNKDKFMQYKDASYIKRNEITSKLKNILLDYDSSTPEVFVEMRSSFDELFKYLNEDNAIPDDAVIIGYIDSFIEGFNAMVDTMSYNSALEIMIDSIDVYGLGFSLQYIVNCFNRHNMLTDEEFTRLTDLFSGKMCNFNPITRVIDLDVLINEYETILLQMGVLTRLNKKFDNHNVVEATTMNLGEDLISKRRKLYDTGGRAKSIGGTRKITKWYKKNIKKHKKTKRKLIKHKTKRKLIKHKTKRKLIKHKTKRKRVTSNSRKK